MLYIATVATPIALCVMLIVWLLWSWAAARLLHGLIVGAADWRGG